jgi:hypothetical protein
MCFGGHFTGKMFVLAVAALGFSACGPTGEHEPSFGDAWVAPATLQVRQELTLRSPVSVVLLHGDKVDLLARRRRFVKIRAGNGAEGWTDSRLLLSADARDRFDDLQDRAAEAPSLGQATVLDVTTVHSAPYRQAPALYQIQPKKVVDIIAHLRFERQPYDPPPLVDEVAARPRRAKKKEKKESKNVPPPPPGPAPSVPDDWLLISGYPQDHLPDEKPAPTPPPPAAPPVMDDWTLVRYESNRSGWVLDRLLYLTLPDDVIQYAERARIVSHYELGSIRDGDLVKPVYFWAAQSAGHREFEFDSLRIFTWSTRRHRWETSWIEHNVQGAGPVTLTRDGKNVTGFRAYAIEKDGKLMRRDYALQNNRARIVGRVAEPLPAPWFVAPKKSSQPGAVQQPEAPPLTVWQKTKLWFSRLRAGRSH